MRGSWRLSLAILLAATAAWACDTPVYRYAMYQWAPAPYAIYLLHDQPLDASHQAVVSELQRVADDPTRSANLALTTIDLAAEDPLSSLPNQVRASWQTLADADAGLPRYLVFTPQGALIYSGDLTTDDVAQMADSPARRAIAAQLDEGVGCVLVLLSGLEDSPEASAAEADDAPAVGTQDADAAISQDPAGTAVAEQQVARLVEDVNSGKLELHPAAARNLFALRQAPEENAQQPAVDESENAAVPHEIRYLRVSRTDPAEQWLVRSLLAIESDLSEMTQPMVFPVYGRGRALPPYVGLGIRWDNLLEAVEYVTGACSCTVKEENPGMDLLVRHDWITTAEKLAERFGSEEGNELQLASDELFPQLIIPTANPEAMLAEADTQPEPAQREAALESEPARAPADADSLGDHGQAQVPAQVPGDDTQPAIPAAASDVLYSEVVPVRSGMLMFAAVVAGLVILAVVTILVVPRG